MKTQDFKAKEKKSYYQPNGKPISRFASPYEEPLAEKSVSVRLTVEINKFVRSLPNKTEWLRQAIAEKYEREQSNQDLAS